MSKKTIPLSELRGRINEIDRGLLELLRARRETSIEVVRTKDAEDRPVRDLVREQEALVRLIQLGKDQGLDAHFVTRVFRELIEDSVKLQQGYLQDLANTDTACGEAVRVAYQGAPGAYSHQATEKFFGVYGERLHPLAQAHFTAVIEAVERGEADYGVLPIENTTSGTISETYDLLLHTRLAIVGEEKLRIEHCLLGLPGPSLNQIRSIYSHPVAAAQCTRFTASLAGVEVHYWSNTATAAQKIQAEQDPSQAAIASEDAGERYGLAVLKRNIANQGQNYTRFIVVARTPVAVDERIPCKTSLVLATRHISGALVAALSVFRDHAINLTKIESRPILGNPWEEMFYLDLEGNRDAPAVRAALTELARYTRFLKVLGSYPSSDLPEPVPTGVALATASRPSGETPAPEPALTVQLGQTLIGAGGFVLGVGPSAGLPPGRFAELARLTRELNLGLMHGLARPLPDQARLGEIAGAHELPYVLPVSSAQALLQVPPSVQALALPADAAQRKELLEAAGSTPLPVLLPRGLASVTDWLAAAETIAAGGNQQVLLLETGVRAESGHLPDLVAVAELKARTRFPVLVALAGAPMSAQTQVAQLRAARAVGADGALLSLADEHDLAHLAAVLD